MGAVATRIPEARSSLEAGFRFAARVYGLPVPAEEYRFAARLAVRLCVAEDRAPGVNAVKAGLDRD